MWDPAYERGCQLGYIDSKEEVVPEEQATERKPSLEEDAAAMGLTPAKLQAMKDYARHLHLSDRRMKESTIRRKVAEKFKIKVI